MKYNKLEFTIYPKLYIDDDENEYEIILKKNKYVDNKLLERIIKDMLSSQFKKHLYTCIFDTGSNDIDDISQYLDGKILNINYNKSKKNFTIKISLFLAKKIPKNYSSLSKKDLLEPEEINKLLTKKNIKNMVAENINHVYRSSGHFKDYNKGDVNIYVNLDSSNKRFVSNFNIN